MTKKGGNSLTYRDSGVDVDAGNELVRRIAPFARGTRRSGTEAGLGGYGAVFDPRAAGYSDPILVSTTDGVGTKLKIAIDAGRHDTVGIDLVAMNVNDLVVQGAEPLFFLDYFATGKLEVGVAARVIEGIALGCKEAGCALVGGETAEMPGFYKPGEYDLAGFAVGAAERGRLLDGADVGVGDVLLGLASSGFHSNGYSLVRKIVETEGLGYASAAPFDKKRMLADALLVPTRIYVRSCLAAIRAGTIKALAHITGGGFVENVPRVFAENLAATIEAGAWRLPPVFAWAMRAGGIADREMVRTFNCGIGMVAIVGADKADEAARILREHGETVYRIGRMSARAKGAPGCTVEGTAAWRA